MRSYILTLMNGREKQPIKETHHVYTIPAQSTYVQPTTYQMPMTAMYPAGMTPIQWLNKLLLTIPWFNRV